MQAAKKLVCNIVQLCAKAVFFFGRLPLSRSHDKGYNFFSTQFLRT